MVQRYTLDRQNGYITVRWEKLLKGPSLPSQSLFHGA